MFQICSSSSGIWRLNFSRLNLLYSKDCFDMLFWFCIIPNFVPMNISLELIAHKGPLVYVNIFLPFFCIHKYIYSLCVCVCVCVCVYIFTHTHKWILLHTYTCSHIFKGGFLVVLLITFLVLSLPFTSILWKYLYFVHIYIYIYIYILLNKSSSPVSRQLGSLSWQKISHTTSSSSSVHIWSTRLCFDPGGKFPFSLHSHLISWSQMWQSGGGRFRRVLLRKGTGGGSATAPSSGESSWFCIFGVTQ